MTCGEHAYLTVVSMGAHVPTLDGLVTAPSGSGRLLHLRQHSYVPLFGVLWSVLFLEASFQMPPRGMGVWGKLYPLREYS